MSARNIIIGIVVLLGLYWLYTSYFNTPAVPVGETAPVPGLPATGTPGQQATVNGRTYSWVVNGVSGYTGPTGWKYNAL